MEKEEIQKLIVESFKGVALEVIRGVLKQFEVERKEILSFLKSREQKLSLHSRLCATELIINNVPSDFIKSYINDAVLREMAPITEVSQ